MCALNAYEATLPAVARQETPLLTPDLERNTVSGSYRAQVSTSFGAHYKFLQFHAKELGEREFIKKT